MRWQYHSGMDAQERRNLFTCYICHLVRDETTGSWIPKRTYREWTGIDPATCLLSRMYCPTVTPFALVKPHSALDSRTPVHTLAADSLLCSRVRVQQSAVEVVFDPIHASSFVDHSHTVSPLFNLSFSCHFDTTLPEKQTNISEVSHGWISKPAENLFSPFGPREACR